MEEQNFIKYVREYLTIGLSHSQIARKLGMSLTHFENKFRDISGEKPVEPVEEVKPVPKKRATKKTKIEKENEE